MPHLIDGYNLLHEANIVVDPSDGPYTLEKSRMALMRFLATLLAVEERTLTTVVFDGREAPAGLPKELLIEGIQVFFSNPGEEADDLIEQLLPTYTAPRQLTVVSSDHRVQRAARRRRARAVDCRDWVREQSAARDVTPRCDDDRGDCRGLSPDEVQQWLDEFGER